MAKQSNIIVEQALLSANPSSPPAGYGIIFPKTDGLWYIKDAAGNVTQIEITSNKDIDGTLAANSDTKYPSQKAVKTYVASAKGGSAMYNYFNNF